MRIGLNPGDRGEDVERLQRVLRSSGLEIEQSELDSRHFGNTTLAALQAFQRRCGLPPTVEIDETTLAFLIDVEEKITINIYEGPQPPPVPKPPDPGKGIVTGTLTDEDGAGVAQTHVTLLSMQIRGQSAIGSTTSDGNGAYRITYKRTAALNLAVTASDDAGATIATSATVFAAPAQVVIDFTTAPDGIIRAPSQYMKLLAAVNAGLHGTPLVDLRENSETQELTFLANAIGVPFRQVAYLYVADTLASKHALLPQTLYGLFVERTPPMLDSALADLLQGGIDDAFTSQVFAGVLNQVRSTLDAALTAAVAADVLPASYSGTQSSELDKIDALRVTATAASPYITGKASLNDLLAAGSVSAEVQSAFLSAYAASGRRLGPTWSTLRANKNLPLDDLTTLQTTLSASQLLRGNVPLVKDTMQRIGDQTLGSVRDLALLDQGEWEARIAQVDPDAASIPPVLPDETVAQRIARFAKSLAQRFASRYPTTAFVGGLSKATTSSFKSKDELVRVLTANPTLSFRKTNIDQFIATNSLTISPPALKELKTAQRLHRVSPHYTSVEALNAAGYTSAQSIYFAGRAPFVVQMSGALGSEPLAQMAFARAQMNYATSLMAFGRYNASLNGTSVSSITAPTPPPGTLANLPDLQALFGSLDYFECEDCQSVYSPAAYLVDLLQYLSWFKATPIAGSAPPVSTIGNSRDALLLRRPDIEYVALSCDNTNTVIPYIDLVNEILEAAIAPTSIARPTSVDTEGTTAERAAVPQDTQPAVSAAAYAATASVTYPLGLPFDVNFARTTAYIAALGTTRAALLQLFPNAVDGATVAGAMLGLNSEMESVVVSVDTTDPWTRWGFTQNPDPVVDPKTRQPYSPNPTDWVAALNYVPVLMNRTGLSLQQLYQLLEVLWVTQGTVTLQAGTTTNAGLQILDPDTDAMVFTGLTGSVLDRANRYLRLWTASGLQMWELDWGLENAVGGALDDAFLQFLSGAIAVRTQLNLPFQEVLTFWSQVETRDVTSHLGDEDTVVPSTYSEVFANTAMLASWSALFANPATLSGAQIVYPASANPTTSQLQPLGGVAAALGLDAADISAILAASGAANALTLPTLTVLLQYQRLASSLSLSVSDLILWIALADGVPFGGTPADTLEFLRRLAVLQGTGIAIHDLDYLLRNQSVTQSALTFTATQSTAVLQTMRDAIAKLTSTSTGTTQLTLTAVSSSSPIALTTVQPHGLQTGDLVLVTGVTGNTAADGIFSVTVTTPAAFTLDGSSANGTWTGGGSVATDLAATIQTIVVAALVSATGVTADVVTPVLTVAEILPLDLATIQALLAQPTVDPTQFTALVAAFTQVDKAASLFTGLAPTSTAFAFLVENAATFGWLDPSRLPLAPVASIPYLAFEKLLRALKLQQRLAARSPKLFDVLAQWLLPGQLPGDVPTALAGPTLTISAATNATPIAITTTTPHDLQTGDQVAISLVAGNTAANGTYTITVTAPTTFTLDGSTGSGAYTGGGVVDLPGAYCIASALNASIADVTAIATELAVNAPSLTPATQAGTLADIGTLTLIANALDVLVRFGISGSTLVQLAAEVPGTDTASAAMAAFQTQYNQNSWLAAIGPVENPLRQNRRDALVAYLLGPGAVASPGAAFLTTDDIFDYYLIDPEMCACGQTTRLLQPSLAIQQFVQQCFLNLTINATVDTTDPRWTEWSWRQQYRLWQANREVFLYPENYVLPETRTNASSFFSDLENDLQQSNCDADSVEAAMQNYLRSLVGVARLRVAAHYVQPNGTPEGATVMWVFARSRGNPAQWWYRTRTTLSPGSGVWSAWTTLNLDIASDQLLPVVWDQRLYLIWPIFHLDSEKQSSQSVPSGGGGPPQPPPQKFWAVEFAMSEFSAGQWQAKQTLDQRMFIIRNIEPLVDRPPQAFTFRASQDSSFNLQLQTYYTLSAAELLVDALLGELTGSAQTYRIATGTLSLPDAPLYVTQDPNYMPAATVVDLTQEPTYAWVTQTTESGDLIAPQGYSFSGQDNIYGEWYQPSTGTVRLNVLAETTANATPGNVTLLDTIVAPRIVIPQQEPTFDSLDPFFVNDPGRTYLVQPAFYTLGSRPTEIDSLAYVSQWSTAFQFETFYHPYARTFLRELEVGGVDQLMSRNLQLNPQQVRGWPTTFDFQTIYQPQPPVAKPYPGAPGAPDPGETALDFDPGCGGAYSLYNWEVFYHAPMFVAAQLLANNQFSDALAWLEYIFNPTDNSGGPAPQRFWEFAPFFQLQAADWIAQQIQNLLTTLATDTQQGISDPATTNAIVAWMNDPYDPHAVASTRITAYAKAAVMSVLNTLIAWGDSLYAVYTAENVSQAEQLYILADMILGPQPDEVRLPTAQQSAAPTYASLKNLDIFSNTLVSVENVIVAPEPPQSIIQGSSSSPSLPQFPGNGNTLLFCIPPNEQLLAYWGTVAQRLYNIRNCLNMQGVAQPLPLYAPPINPLQLIEAQAAGGAASGATSVAPIYRFQHYMQKAVEMTNDVRAYGALILAALEKQDAETLALLRANQELAIQTMMLDVKTKQVTEAQDQITVLQNQQAVTQIRYNFYSTQAFMNAWETAAITLQGAALIANGVGLVLDMTSGIAHLVPTMDFGAAGFGGSPMVAANYGGENVASSATSWASVARSIAGILGESAGMAQTMGSYQHRQNDWTLQANLAQAEITQIESQIVAANDRLQIAQTELTIQNTQIANAQVISTFLTNKYTNAQLYNWMVSQLSTVYAQAYQLAFSLAQQAQTAYQYELGRPLDQFIQFAYWDSQYKGLTAGESLLFDLRRMDSQFTANNTRELELTKHVSLALTQPQALVQLLQTGSCTIALDETLFDFDHPGQYFRRLRSVAVTIPCVTGPYTGVNATLTLAQSVVRTSAPSAGFQPWIWATSPTNTDPNISASPAVSASPIMATSSGQNDGGLFDLNLRDERWLPFEGQGAVCLMSLELDPRDNNFDLSSVTDVVLHVRYSARPGGDANAVRAALVPLNARTILVSVRNTFGDNYYSFFNPTDTTATQQTLTVALAPPIFPYSNLGTPVITDVTMIVALSEPLTTAESSALSSISIPATFGPATGTAQDVTFKAAPGTAPGGGAIPALTAAAPYAVAAATGSFTLTVPSASIPASLQTTGSSPARFNSAAIDDIVLVITYDLKS
jgi:hypothetical protein